MLKLIIMSSFLFMFNTAFGASKTLCKSSGGANECPRATNPSLIAQTEADLNHVMDSEDCPTLAKGTGSLNDPTGALGSSGSSERPSGKRTKKTY